MDAALNHGANGIEIDVCAWYDPNEWRACHDCSSAGENRYGPSFDGMIDRILSNAKSGRRLPLVWLDIKDPNYCGEAPNRACSVAGPRDKAQRLTAAGIQVLYGLYEYHGGSTPDVGGRGNVIKLVRDWVNRHSATHRMDTSGDRLFRLPGGMPSAGSVVVSTPCSRRSRRPEPR